MIDLETGGVLVVTLQRFNGDLLHEQGGDGGEEGDRQNRRLFLGQLKRSSWTLGKELR